MANLVTAVPGVIGKTPSVVATVFKGISEEFRQHRYDPLIPPIPWDNAVSIFPNSHVLVMFIYLDIHSLKCSLGTYLSIIIHKHYFLCIFCVNSCFNPRKSFALAISQRCLSSLLWEILKRLYFEQSLR